MSWYRQRFDACPHFISFIGDVHTRDIVSTEFDYGVIETVGFFEKDRTDWLHNKDNLRAVAKNLQMVLSRSFIDKLQSESQKRNKAYYVFCDSFPDITTYSLLQLRELYETFCRVYKDVLFTSSLIDGYALTTDENLIEQIKEQVSDEDDIQNLIAHPYLSFSEEEKLGRLQMQLSGVTAQKLTKHQKDFYWIQNNYVDDLVLSVSDFQKRIDDEKFSQDELHKLQNMVGEVTKQKMNLYEKYSLCKELILEIQFTDFLAHLQDERKKNTSLGTHFLTCLLTAIAKKTKYTLAQLKYTLPSEMTSIFTEELDEVELSKRSNGIVFSYSKKAVTQKPISFFHSLFSENRIKKDMLKGLSVNKGKVTGKVKVIKSVKEISLIREGDILVAVMTRPDYFMGMKKLAAIVTDEGGITSHAAIVARELGVPCIVNTKIATRVFKDGDVIEVDADAGVVRKLK